MPRIQQLTPQVVNKIAAGEVIERPASVVKELLENSVDALATRIEVDIADGGAELIRIVDDGEGIHPDDMLLSVTSHATSKISNADDLFHVQTLGFRGEALASIAEVSQFRIRSRTPENETGIELEVRAGQAGPLQTCGCPPGTLIEIRQLFCNTPVRRKFLKTSSTELGHITEQFTRVALAHPRLHLVLRHNQKVIYELPGTNRLIERLRLFYGNELAEHLIWVESELQGNRVWGYVGHPSQSKSTRKGQYLFLNGRWIQDRSLQHALGEAYRGLLMVGRYPVVFLFLEMPPDQVDVNVHPTKSEVRFRDSQTLYRLLLSTLRTKFLGMNLDSEFKLKPPPEGTTKPPVDVQRQLELQTELADWAKSKLANWQPPVDDDGGGQWQGGEPNGPIRPGVRLDGGIPEFQPYPDYGPRPSMGAAMSTLSAPQGHAAGQREGTEVAAQTQGPALPPAVRAMQVHDAYLVAETEEGLTVIDQHALHERVLYEQFRHRVLGGSVESQKLLIPETFELSPAECGLLQENQETLAQLGFGLEPFGGQTMILNSYPVMLSKVNPVQLIREIAEKIASTGQAPTRRDLLDEILHMMSCKAAVKAGQRLGPEEIDSLLAQRHLIDDAHHCPHGRPTALVLSRAELDRQFGRMG